MTKNFSQATSSLPNLVVEEERVQLLFNNAEYGAWLHLIVVGALMASIWDVLEPQVIVPITAGLITITLYRLVFIYRFKSPASNVLSRQELVNRYALIVGATGLCWGAGGSFLATSELTAEFMLYVFVVGGASAGALATLAPYAFVFTQPYYQLCFRLYLHCYSMEKAG
jgi:hypothetical protein